MPQLWQLGLRGEHVKVGVVGTGIDLEHLDFAHNTINAFSLVGSSVDDTVGHETAVVWVITRIAPRAIVTVAKEHDSTYGHMNTMIDACERLRHLGVQIINISMSTDLPTDGTDPLSREVNFLVQQGIAVVTAAGNKGPRWQTIGAPGAAELALTVGKVDRRDIVPGKSSRGPTVDGRLKPDCVAPGVQIRAAVSHDLNVGLYGYYTCTSFAAPHVVGSLALLLEAYRDATPGMLKRAIMESCDPVGTGGKLRSVLLGQGDPRWVRGAGRVNAYQAYEWLKKNGGGC